MTAIGYRTRALPSIPFSASVKRAEILPPRAAED